MHNPPYTGKKILVVVAHPDDETFGMGGTIAFYAHQGAEVHLVCATRGEAGEVSPEKMVGFDSVGELRENELRCAASILKIKEVHFLNYLDSGMAGTKDNENPKAFINADWNKVQMELVLLMRSIQPDIVLTFDAIGGYMHPDHIAVHQATVAACKLSSDENYVTEHLPPFSPKRLYFHIIPRKFMKVILRLMPLFGVDPSRFGKNKDINLNMIVDQDFPIHTRINYKNYVKIRESASACHASQGGDRQSGFIVTWLMRLLQPVESFMQAYPEYKSKNPQKDLFQGL